MSGWAYGFDSRQPHQIGNPEVCMDFGVFSYPGGASVIFFWQNGCAVPGNFFKKKIFDVQLFGAAEGVIEERAWFAVDRSFENHVAAHIFTQEQRLK